jgi:hypothetical protein
MFGGHFAHRGVVTDDIGGAGDAVFNIWRGNSGQAEGDEFLWFLLLDHDDSIGV